MQENEEKPPVFSHWRSWYAVVVLLLILQIILFAIFTKYFE